jgi:hypothetical protein
VERNWASLVLEVGAIAVVAKGKYVCMSLEQIGADGMEKPEWFADKRPVPSDLNL